MKRINLKKLSVGSIITTLNTLAFTVMAKAEESADWLKSGAEADTNVNANSNMFSALNGQIQNLGASGYNTLKIVAIIFGCIGLVSAAFMMASGSAQKLDAAKTKVLWTIIAIILAFAAVTLITIAIGVGNSIE